jgi:hypothetical protein
MSSIPAFQTHVLSPLCVAEPAAKNNASMYSIRPPTYKIIELRSVMNIKYVSGIRSASHCARSKTKLTVKGNKVEAWTKRRQFPRHMLPHPAKRYNPRRKHAGQAVAQYSRIPGNKFVDRPLPRCSAMRESGNKRKKSEKECRRNKKAPSNQSQHRQPCLIFFLLLSLLLYNLE